MIPKSAWLSLAAPVAACISCAAVAQTCAPYEPFTLSWVAPQTNSDGSAITDLLGYYIYVGDSPEGMQPIWFIGADRSSVQLSYGTSGDYYFALVAVNADGLESFRTEPVLQTVIDPALQTGQ